MSKPDFVSLSDLSSTIQINANYAGEDNFTGQRVDGYRAKKILLARVVAEALVKVQAEALKLNLTLKIFDGYRPNKATLFFQKWSQLPEDNIQRKQRFYPTYAREELFAHGFIALKSSHSRGCAVDLTLASIGTYEELDMGTEFDYFNDLSHTLNPEIQGRQLENRLLLKNLMEAQGFRNYSKEWWHFSFIQEPYPDVWFDFDIE